MNDGSREQDETEQIKIKLNRSRPNCSQTNMIPYTRMNICSGNFSRKIFLEFLDDFEIDHWEQWHTNVIHIRKGWSMSLTEDF